MRGIAVWGLLGWMCCAVAVPAAAAEGDHLVFAGITGEQFAGYLRDQGYKAELDKDSEGDPMIRSAASGAKFRIYFYGCSKAEERVCKSVQFMTFWTKEGFTPEQANTYNSSYRSGKLWLGSDALYLTLEAELDGVSPAYFTRLINRWENALGNAYRFFDRGGKG